jgi:hypothetical protein
VRLLGDQPKIRDGLRGEALMLRSAPGEVRLDSDGNKSVRWDCDLPMLVTVPGWEPYMLTPRRHVPRAKRYPVVGTTLAVTVDRNDASKLRVEWDEVPTLDERIAAGERVFTDPDTVEVQVREAMATGARRIARASEEEARGKLDPAIDHAQVQRVLGQMRPQAEPPPRREPPPGDRPTARVLATTPMGSGLGIRREILLSVHVPGRGWHGLRWKGNINGLKLLAEWSDIPVSVDPGRPDKVEILWDQIPSGLAEVAGRLDAAGDTLQSQTTAGPASDAAMFQQLISAAIPAPEQRAAVQQQIASALQGSPAVPRPAPPDPLDQLEQLAKLRDAGALTDAEFAAEKARVLGQL